MSFLSRYVASNLTTGRKLKSEERESNVQWLKGEDRGMNRFYWLDRILLSEGQVNGQNMGTILQTLGMKTGYNGMD